MNNIIICGNLVANPETGKSKKISYTRFTVAVNGANERVDFIPVVAFNALSDVCEKYLKKGDKVVVNGALQIDNTQDDKGVWKTYVSIVCRSVEFMAKK